MINYQTARRKLNRRRSSVFIPEQPSILQKMTHIISNAAQTFSTRYGLHHATNTAERIVIPNYQVDYTIQRCKLYNYQTYCGNKIKTTKYGLITFIPKNLWEQFHRIANLYFILIAAMNWIPVLEAVDPYLPMLPVLIVFGLTALKDAYSDFCRGKLDRQVNRSFCHVWDREENRFRKMHWEDVIVGDFLHISLNEIIPADILLIRSSDPDGNCFLETSNLDGETSLKPRYVPPSLLEHSGEEILHHPVDFCTKISCEKPNNRIYQMKGYIIRNNKITETISSENMLLRGCQLRNTAFIEGIVLYAGSETKVMMSSSDPSYKRSSLEVATNCFILHCILILISMCLLTGIASIFWLSSYLSNIRKTLIPLSLYISVEFIKLFQIYFISQDITMYDAYRDRVTECRSLNIPEELGCIQYIMSDKTGTLTENLMMFRGCAIGGVNYTCEPRPGDSGNLRVDNVMVNSELKDRVEVMNWHTDRILMDFFITMALCNTIVVNTKSHVERGLIKNDILDVDHDMKIEQNRVAGYSKILRDTEMWNLTKKVYFDKWSFLTRWSKFARKSSTEMNRWKRNEDYKELVYEGESADELALAYAARAYGIKLLKRSKQRVVLILPQNNNQAFDILRLLPFDSTRKKMSIIVRMNDEITLYCKGADSEILNSLSDCKSKQSITVQLTKEILKAYSMQGLRTLCLAKRHLTLTEYEQWMMKHTEIENNVGSLTYEKELHQSFASIESNLEFLGVTAVEDKLQDGVEDTIVNLRKAGIQIWLLTGDKMETAVNIARSCGLFPPTSTVYMLNTEDDVHEAHKQILTHNNLNYCIVLSSDVLFLFVKQDSKFLHILQRSISVLCHRMTPSNKAKIVRIAKEVLHGGVLAIGDGANDVPMIQCADVGIGVYGQEGLQVNCSMDSNVGAKKNLVQKERARKVIK
uniref:P-type ATPase N-terminal domain-containing protein n=1 Tax=Setaria digitata TaxID=48799 RepID=A0A915PNG5_9BILA